MSSLFGATQNKPSLFVTPPSTNNSQQTTGGLFGQSQPQAQQQSNSLFGQTSQNQQPSTSLFGQTAQNEQRSTSLFGQPQQQQTSNSLFGQPQQQQPSSNPFGQPQQQTSNSLFGQPQQQSSNSIFGQPKQQSSSLFGQPQQQQSNSLFGAPPQQQQQQQQQQQSSLFGSSQNQPQQSLTRSIWQPDQMPQAREKTIPEQMQTILEKWSPESSACLFQKYFYNTVPVDQVPYFGPGPGEDETKWEEALSNKPAETSIPALSKGFANLGQRLQIQAKSVQVLRARLHEINSSLESVLKAHDLDITIRTKDTKRRHIVLNQRCLQLATKIQVLKNRGYALDGAEEGLRKKLMDLERGAFDPRTNGRQEEIWARMVGLRDRARFLQEETERTGRGLAGSNGEVLDEEIMKKTKKILKDYDSQIAHLTREMDVIQGDFSDWEKEGSGFQTSSGR